MRPVPAVGLLLLMAAAGFVPALAQSGPQLVSPSPNPVVRFPVVHAHPADVCYGFLDFSRSEIRYQAVRPAKYGSHGFSMLREQVISVTMQPSFRLKASVAEFNLAGGSKHGFGRVRRSAVENESETAAVLLPLQDVLEAVNKFEVLAARLEGRDPPAENAAASKPAEAKAAAKPAPPPTTPQSATLVITSYPPGAQVWVDANSRGPTDAQSGQMRVTRVPAGRSYRIRVSAQGYQEWAQTVSPGAGQTLAVDARLTPSGPPPFSVRDIVELLQGEVPPTRVAALVAERGVDFALSREAEQQIRAAGGDAELLVAIVKARK